MALTVSKLDVWASTLQDKPGSLAQKLDALAEAGADLSFVIARRTPEKKGKGVVYVTPLSGARQLQAARDQGFAKAQGLRALRIDCTDRPGIGADVCTRLAEAGLNLRGFSAAVIGSRGVINLAFDSPEDASRAGRLLRAMT